MIDCSLRGGDFYGGRNPLTFTHYFREIIHVDNDKVITAVSLQLILDTMSNRKTALHRAWMNVDSGDKTKIQQVEAKMKQTEEAMRELLAYGKKHYPSIYKA